MRAYLVLAAVAACGKIPAPAGDASSGSYTVALDKPGLFVRRAGMQTATVTVTRASGFTGDVMVGVASLPTGVTADPLMIANPGTTGTLTLHATATATEGVAMVSVHGDSGTASVAAALRLLVGGAPGTLDESFATGGKFVTALGANALVGRGLVVVSDGGIVAVGVNLGMSQTVLVKVTSAGVLDASFGANGIVTTGAGAFAEGIAIVQLASGKLVVGGVANGDGTMNDDYGVFQYSSAGALDTTFASSGVASVDLTPGVNSFEEIHTVAILADGSIVACGPDFGTSTISHELHYSATGTLDAGFDVPETAVVMQASVVQPDGKLVVAGSNNGKLWIGRYNATGGHDNGFGTSGATTTDLGTGGAQSLDGLILLTGGKLLGVGSNGTNAVVVRYNANGSPDLTFGTNGVVTTTTAFSTRSPNAAAIDAAGKIYYVGVTSSKPTVARFNADGSTDSTFGTGGIAAIDFGVAGSNAQTGGYGVAIDSDGRVVISGDVGAAGTQRLAIGRLWP